MISRLISIFKQIKQCHREHGLKTLIFKLRVRGSLIIKHWINKNILKKVNVRDFLTQAYPHAAPIDSFKIQRDSPRFNLVLDHLKEEGFFGGVSTALILAALFANKQNIPLRVISRVKESQPDQLFKFLQLQNITLPKKIEFFSDYDRAISGNRARLETSDQDIYMATSWWTAEAIQGVNFRPSYFHLVQDTPLDSNYRHSLALNDPKAKYISNQKLQGSAFYKAAFPEKTHAHLPSAFLGKSKYKLFFYSRPSKPQTQFLAGLKLIEEALTRGILATEEWEICFAGEKTPALLFSVGLTPKVLGKLTWEDYLAFIKTVDLGICLNDSNHPNYPALDVAACGGVVLTNNMNHCKQSENIIYTPLEKLLEGLNEAVSLVKDPETRLKNYRKNQIERSWEETLKETLIYMDENK